MYHSVGGGGLSPDIVVSEKHFDGHIRYLRRHYKVLSLERVVALMESRDAIPRNGVVVTLDDGYRDNYDKAFPILRRYKCPATVFVAVQPVQTGRLPWAQRLWRWLQSAEVLELNLSWRSANGTPTVEKHLSLRTAQDRARARSWLRSFAGGLGAEDRERFLGAVAGGLGCTAEPEWATDRAMLTWDEVRKMAECGISIGSHTMTHPRLSGLDRQTVREELVESRRALEKELNTAVPLFAYPFGSGDDFNEDTKDAVTEAGYKAACSALVGDSRSDVDLRALERAYVPDEPTWLFALRLAHLETKSCLIAWALRRW